MFKKRPRLASLKTKENSKTFHGKMEPEYWKKRLFRNTFTSNGNRFQVNHWSIKIQHRGTRKAFSLHAGDTAKAAVEACRLYRTIVTQGWKSASIPESGNKPRSSSAKQRVQKELSTDYWTDRLIYRKYTEKFHPTQQREFSVRIDHAGTNYYYPLRTDHPQIAARRAASIYAAVVRKGWDKTNEHFPRELSLAFHWVGNPVAWTYTTIQTLTKTCPLPLPAADRPASEMLNVGIVESDAGIRKALAWCVEQQKGVRCLGDFVSAAEAVKQVPLHPFHLILVSQNLADQKGTGFLKNLDEVAPKVSSLVFSVYEDCDSLFARAPGGAGSYIFRRTSPTRILEPLSGAWDKSTLTRDHLASKVRLFFERAVASLPVGDSTHALTHLTQRELEILGLLSKGQADKEIADLLRISTWTVHGHLKKIFEKLGAHNRTEAVLKYLHK